MEKEEDYSGMRKQAYHLMQKTHTSVMQNGTETLPLDNIPNKKIPLVVKDLGVIAERQGIKTN